jgi:UDP-N-acetylglucosamine 3-dehydrogenase
MTRDHPVSSSLRALPEYALARERVISGQLGQIGTAYTFCGGAFPSDFQNSSRETASQDFSILDWMLPDFDFLRWCFGEVERVYAKHLALSEKSRVDHAFVSIRFANGVIASAEASWAYPPGLHREFEIAGAEGLLRHQSGPSQGLQAYRWPPQADHSLLPMAMGASAVMSAEAVREALRIRTAASESATTGRVVTLGGGCSCA